MKRLLLLTLIALVLFPASAFAGFTSSTGGGPPAGGSGTWNMDGPERLYWQTFSGPLNLPALGGSALVVNEFTSDIHASPISKTSTPHRD